MVVDRPSRDQSAACIEAFLDGRNSETELKDEARKILAASTDAVVEECGEILSTTDLDDDLGVDDDSARSTWQELQRRLLLLHSDAGMEATNHGTPWYARVAAAVALVGCGAAICLEGGWAWVAAAPLGMVWCWYTTQESKAERRTLGEMHPFDSYAQLAAVRKSVPTFQKRHCPFKPPIRGDGRIAPSWLTALNGVLMGLALAAAGMLLLLVSLLETALTHRRKTYRVLLEGEDSLHIA